MGVYITIFILFTLAYGALFYVYFNGWKQQKEVISTTIGTLPALSIIIPARNEEANIEKCVQSILDQKYDGTLELIVINDHSSDNTLALLEKFKGHIKIINLEAMIEEKEAFAYKKKAIELAILKATGDLILTTDADTWRAPNWANAMVTYYKNNNYKILAGPVNYYEGSSILNKFQCIDFLIMQGITAASLAKNIGSSCNGANLLYSKNTFLSVNGFAKINHLASGDDLLLMHKIEQKYPKGAGFVKSKEAIVFTDATPTWQAFFQQRIRWASKTKHYKDVRLQIALIIIFLYNLLFVVTPFLVVLGYFNLWLFMFFLSIKIIAEQAMLNQVTLFFNASKFLKIWHILLQPLHWLYIITSGFLSQFSSYTWKERKVQ